MLYSIGLNKFAYGQCVINNGKIWAENLLRESEKQTKITHNCIALMRVVRSKDVCCTLDCHSLNRVDGMNGYCVQLYRSSSSYSSQLCVYVRRVSTVFTLFIHMRTLIIFEYFCILFCVFVIVAYSNVTRFFYCFLCVSNLLLLLSYA